MPQVFILVLLLPGIGRLDRLREFIWLFVVSCLICIGVSWILPAEGAWGYYKVAHLTSNHYLSDFYALRAGKMPEILMDQITGIVQFPSFHTAAALLLIYATREIFLLFPISLVLNVMMIAATPVYGGHHFADMIAGAAVVPVAIILLRQKIVAEKCAPPLEEPLSP